MNHRTLDERVAGRPVHIWLPEGMTLPVVPDPLLKCVVFLGYKDAHGDDHFMGTAFWVARPRSEEFPDRFRATYLVTAAHVIEDIKTEVGEKGLVQFRVNLKEGGQKWESTPLCCWRSHHDPGADLAVFKVDLNVNLWDHFAWGEESFATKNSVALDGGRRIEHGDDLAIAGLFSSHAGTGRNIPIVRTAHVAALPDEPVRNGKGNSMKGVFLVECRSIGGLSGSPVFYDIYAAKEKHLGESRFVRTPIKWRLMGVMHGHFNAPDVMPDAVASEAERKKILINMGIAIVVPAEKISEVLATFMDEEKRELEEFRKTRMATIQPDSLANEVEMQTTPQGEEIPIPTEGQFLSDLQKVSRKTN